MARSLKFIVSIAVSLAAGAIGTIATIPNIPTWYTELHKPLGNPPNWVFGPVWTTLYILMGISLYLVWIQKTSHSKSRAYKLFGAQLVLNTLWSVVFFGFHQPWWGVIIILALLFCILLMIRCFWSINRIAAYLLIPYAIWVGFATYLNVAIAFLN